MTQFTHHISAWDLKELPFADLLDTSTMTLSTTGLTGTPHAAPLYFAADQTLNLYFFSDTHSQHMQDIHTNPQAAIAIHSTSQGWKNIYGLQSRGQVVQVKPGPFWNAGWVLYHTKFPFVTELEAILTRNSFFVFQPQWVRLVDNRRGFGYKEEWTLI